MWLERIRKGVKARTTAKDPFHFWLYIAVDPVVLLADLAATNRNAEQQIGFTLAQIGGFIVGWTWFFIAKYLLKKFRLAEHPYWWLVILFGVSITVVTDQAVGVIRFGPQALGNLHANLFAVVAIGALLAAGVALLLGAATKHEQLREGLISARTRKAQGGTESLPEVRAFIAEAKKSLAETRHKDPKEIAQEIRELVDLRLRPISHSIWESEARKLKRFTLGLLVKDILRKPIRLAYIPAGFATIVAARYFLGEFGVFEGWLRISLLFGLIWFVPAAHEYLFQRFQWVRRIGSFSFALSLVTTTAASYLIPIQLLGVPDRVRVFNYLLTSFLVIGLPAIVSSVSASTRDLLRDQRKRLREELGQSLGESTEYVVATTRARDTANYLHGTTQNRLLASALMLETANDDKTVASQLEAIEQTLQDALDQPRQSGGLATQIEALRRSWQGMLAIEYSIPKAVDINDSLSELLTLCVREAASNSFRHGHAKSIRVIIERGDPGLMLRVLDDGIGPRSPRSGLGSKLFDSAGRWKLVAMEDGGAELLIQFR